MIFIKIILQKRFSNFKILYIFNELKIFIIKYLNKICLIFLNNFDSNFDSNFFYQ